VDGYVTSTNATPCWQRRLPSLDLLWCSALSVSQLAAPTYIRRPPWLTSVILATWEAEIGRIIVQGYSLPDPISKIIRAKQTKGVAQAV
jgi:hypothetical protein